jgi:hypothetical protein
MLPADYSHGISLNACRERVRCEKVSTVGVGYGIQLNDRFPQENASTAGNRPMLGRSTHQANLVSKENIP